MSPQITSNYRKKADRVKPVSLAANTLTTEPLAPTNPPFAGLSPRDRGVFLEHHCPTPWTMTYHVHPSIEINFLTDCTMKYSFSGQEVTIPEGKFCLFWAAHPHRVVEVEGEGMITNAHVALAEFLRWPLPERLLSDLLGGAVLASTDTLAGDRELVSRWSTEFSETTEQWERMHALEIQARLHRLGMQGWDTLLTLGLRGVAPIAGGQRVVQFERMLRFVADNYTEQISVLDVASAASISRNYAITIFRRMLGRTIKEHIMDLRLLHSRMLLSETDSKILTIALNSGFGSLSSFYEAFQSYYGISPAAFRKGAKRSP